MRAAAIFVALAGTASALDLEAPAIDESIIAAVNSNKKSTWVAGVNEKFIGMTTAQAARLMGTIREGPHAVRARMSADPWVKPHVGAIPTSFNSSTAWPTCANLISGARDQSDCGSCWAFGSTEAVSDRMCINYNSTVLLSAQDTASCCGAGQGCAGSDGCNGGFPLEAWQWFKKTGVVTGGLYGDTTTCWPYQLAPCSHHEAGKWPMCPAQEDPTPACRSSCSVSGYPQPFAKDRKFAKTAYNVPSDVPSIQAEIMAHGPITAAFTVYQDFITYKSGVYQHTTGQALGGHAVKIIGWGVDGTTPYWTVMNSWNQYWGEWGQFKILRGVDECGIEDELCAGSV